MVGASNRDETDSFDEVKMNTAGCLVACWLLSNGPGVQHQQVLYMPAAVHAAAATDSSAASVGVFGLVCGNCHRSNAVDLLETLLLFWPLPWPISASAADCSMCSREWSFCPCQCRFCWLLSAACWSLQPLEECS